MRKAPHRFNCKTVALMLYVIGLGIFLFVLVPRFRMLANLRRPGDASFAQPIDFSSLRHGSQGQQAGRIEDNTEKRKNLLNLDDLFDAAEPLVRPLRIPYRSSSSFGKSESRGIVVAYHTEDLSWLPVYFPDLTPFVYSANDTLAPHHLVHPLGKEAGAFLSFILDYYDDLPDLIVFIHAHRYSYHTWTQDIVNALSRLRWDRIKGYTPLNLNNLQDILPGYYSKRQLDCPLLYPRLWRSITPFPSLADFDYMRKHWRALFGDEFGDSPPAMMREYCCAQFVVPKETVRLRSRAFYERLYRFVYDPTARVDAPRVLEHSWHFIMGEPMMMTERNNCEIMYCEPGDNGDGKWSPLSRQKLAKGKAAGRQDQEDATEDAGELPATLQ